MSTASARPEQRFAQLRRCNRQRGITARVEVGINKVESGNCGEVERCPKVEARIFGPAWRGLGFRFDLHGAMHASPQGRRALGEQCRVRVFEGCRVDDPSVDAGRGLAGLVDAVYIGKEYRVWEGLGGRGPALAEHRDDADTRRRDVFMRGEPN
jgi:hypothetical protein